METTTIFSRKDYMSKKCSFNEYYAQFVTDSMKQIILNKFSKEQLTEKYNADEHLNNIPLKWWDQYEEFFKQSIARTNKRINGESVWSSCEHTCAMKEAARQIINS